MGQSGRCHAPPRPGELLPAAAVITRSIPGAPADPRRRTAVPGSRPAAAAGAREPREVGPRAEA